MNPKVRQQTLDLVAQKGVVRARELVQVGAAGTTLQQLLQSGDLIRLGRGVYAASENIDQLGMIAIQYPRLVFCLLTALQLHGLTTQSPHEIWVAVGPKARSPQSPMLPLRVVRMGNLDHGVTQISPDGVVQIPVTNVAKTIADCFKYRSKVGIDVAIEALKEAWNKRLMNIDDTWEAAQQARMANVMRPYLETLM